MKEDLGSYIPPDSTTQAGETIEVFEYVHQEMANLKKTKDLLLEGPGDDDVEKRKEHMNQLPRRLYRAPRRDDSEHVCGN